MTRTDTDPRSVPPPAWFCIGILDILSYFLFREPRVQEVSPANLPVDQSIPLVVNAADQSIPLVLNAAGQSIPLVLRDPGPPPELVAQVE